MNDIEDAGRQGDLYIGRSGDPWSASSASNYEKDILLSVPSSANDTKVLTVADGLKETSTHARFKRGVIHLYNMVVCATGCNPLAYKGYGCYCGFLGSGYVIDGIDQCCKMHDWCYDATECPMFSEYFVPYYWRCYHGYKPVCAVEHGDWGGSGSCAQRLCECDRSLAECLKKYPCPTTKAVCTSSPWRLVQNLFMII
ncbi:PREDICTED: basic phospholipase A2 homolog 1 isoform X3 [Dinoponera quadriceps]|nr:PREDICTED: basic phospholipase A2 homolog 1 isoform X3 [Dinoponera quadriceps]XP_014475695.1 PREDICTED: basic phospholipase A2 homolog 1 isoform X3 [Dinoponera quadriceps]